MVCTAGQQQAEYVDKWYRSPCQFLQQFAD